MSEITITQSGAATVRPWSPRMLLWALIPLLLLGALLAVMLGTDNGLDAPTAPASEDLAIDRITLPAWGQMVVEVTNGGDDPITIAQAQVDDAYWAFTISPDATIPGLGQATISLPYPWVQGETHVVKLVSSDGETFEGEVDDATQTLKPDLATFRRSALLGIGFVPVVLGLLWYPFLRRLGRGGMRVVLSLTIGLLVFLLLNTIFEALEIAAQTPGGFGGAPLVFLLALVAFLALAAIGSRTKSQTTSRLGMAYRMALGIGMRNLGQGLAIGAALASGEAALGSFLAIGFTLHNMAEGVGIAAPIARERPGLWHFVALAALAGLPALLGAWAGGFVGNNLAVVVCLALGGGAIAQAAYEVGRLIIQQSAEGGSAAL